MKSGASIGTTEIDLENFSISVYFELARGVLWVFNHKSNTHALQLTAKVGSCCRLQQLIMFVKNDQSTPAILLLLKLYSPLL